MLKSFWLQPNTPLLVTTMSRDPLDCLRMVLGRAIQIRAKASPKVTGFNPCLCIELWRLNGSGPALRVRPPLARRYRAGSLLRFFGRPVIYLHSEIVF
jgi:hypothetical protein